MIFLGSDFHFGHNNILNYCNRPYKDLEEMHCSIVNIWNETVKPEDTIYILGDFSLNIKYVEMFIPILNGEKHLIMGNHENCFPKPNSPKQEKIQKMKDRYFQAGFKTIELYGNINLGRYNVDLCHFPFLPKDNDLYNDTRYSSLRLKNNGQYLCHGHAHSRYRKFGKQIDCGFDGDWKIFSEDDIIKLIEDPRDFIPTPLTEFYRQRKEKENGLV